MLNRLKNQKGVAKALKNVVNTLPKEQPLESEKRKLLADIRQFEGMEWDPHLFQVLSISHDGKFNIKAEDQVSYKPVTNTPDKVIEGVRVLLHQYAEVMKSVKVSTKDLFSIAEAAEYLGLEEATVKYHVYTAENLTGQKIGRSRVFTKQELDAFAENKRPQGRPRKAEA